jgi:hypothetical protein
MTITVTAEDLTQGVRGSHTACPIALAVTRATGADTVSVGRQFIRFWRDGKRYGMYTTPTLWSFIMDFDEGRPVKPFSFSFPAHRSRRARML